MEMRKEWDKLALAANQKIKERDYWLGKLSGGLVKSNFLFEGGKKGPGVGKSMKVNATFDRELFLRSMSISGESDYTLHIVLVAGVVALLDKYTESRDIIVGTPIYKQAAEGEFINTVLPLRFFLEDNTTFKDLLMQTRQTLSEAIEHQNYPIESLADKLGIPKSEDGFSLFDIAILLDNIHEEKYLRPMNPCMKFLFSRNDANLEIVVEYNSSAYREAAVRRIVTHLQYLLDKALGNVNIEISSIEILSEKEKNQLLDTFNNLDVGYPKTETIDSIFEKQADRTPDKIAVIGPSESITNVELTYRELDEQSGWVAHWLREKGVEPDTIVGIKVGRSIEMIIGILGILKAGGAYLPIDPSYPEERTDFMIKDSNIKLILDNSFWKSGNLFSKRFMPAGGIPLTRSLSANSCYIIYTSGTTGKPKGALIEHKNVVRLLFNDKFQFDFNDNDTWTMFHSYSFDFSVWEMYGALLYGGRLIVIPRHVTQDPHLFLEVLKRHRVTILNQTPSAFYSLMNEALKVESIDLNLRYVIFGGEALNPGKLKEWKAKYPNTRLVNMFGITETTVHVTYKGIGEEEIAAESSNIGSPIPTLSVYIMDRFQRIMPIGAAGELYVGGEGVARGYLNRPELTNEKFINFAKTFAIDNLKPKTQNPRLYRTGDLARIMENGDMEYLGRIDQQVQLRGFRIELGEIETRLQHHEDVNNVVVAVISRENEISLCAYIVPTFPGNFNVSKLREYLSAWLPEYMIPSFFVQIESIPLTSNGKIDKRALPEPEIKTSVQYVEPQNHIQEQMQRIWQRILGIEPIGIFDNFFGMGGHSLKGIQLINEIHKELNVKIPLAEIFIKPTISELSEYLQNSEESKYVSLEPVEEKEYYALSSAQKRLYILQQLVLDNTSYNMPYVIPLSEGVGIDKEKLESVFKRLIERHESLRTSFEMVNEDPVQRIRKEVSFSIRDYHASKEDAEKMISGFAKPFDLSQAPLLRVDLLIIEAIHRVLLIDMHHIITDGTSQDILEKEFMKLYKGEEPTALRLQYKDYSEWYNSATQKESVKQQENYWMSEFCDELPTLALPTDFARPMEQSVEGNSVTFNLNFEEAGALKTITRKNDVTLYMSLLSIFTLLLSKLSGQEDIIVGTPIAARRHTDLQQIIGMFVNTLVIRNYPSGEKLYRDYLQEIKQRTLDAYENQEYPFEELVDKITIDRDTSRNPVFDVMFNLSNQKNYRLETSRINEGDSYEHKKRTSKFDMNWAVMDMGEKILVDLEYSTKLFKPSTIERFIGYFKKIIEVLSSEKELKLSGIEIYSEKEKKQLLYGLNETAYDFGNPKTLHQLFEEQVKRTPEKVALVFADRVLTYNELNKKSNRLARVLRKKGVEPDRVVAMMVGRSFEMVIGIMGILKAGGAYLPIDVDIPEERKRYMLCDSAVKLALIHNEKETEFVSEVEGVEIIDVGCREIYDENDRNPCHINTPGDLVYLLYTSGSTGKPKGAMLEHRNLVNLILYGFKFTNLDFSSVLQFSTISFDASFHEIFSALLSGGKLALIEAEKRTAIIELFKVIERNEIKTVFLPMSLLKIIFNEEDYIEFFPRCVTHIQTAGEQVMLSDSSRKYLKEKNIYLHNHYGPSEAHVVTALTLDPSGEIPYLPSIGKPVSNTAIYIMDRYGNLQPRGAAGELYIGGTQVGRGYGGKPEMTMEKFIPNPFIEGDRMYKSGDLTRWLPDGNIEFLGRIDHQVKIRGFRIEPGEIESRLLNHKEIREAVVLLKVDQKGDKYLCAYVVVDSLGELSKMGSISAELRSYLSKRLPDYMIPSYFVKVDRIPLTSNAKVDRKGLPEPVVEPGEGYIPPRSEVEIKLAELWSEVLGIEKGGIGIDSNFFHLGGHSLKATVLTSRINRELGVKLALGSIFKTPTIRGLSEVVMGLTKEMYVAISSAEEKEYYQLSSAQKRLYIIHNIDKNSISYNMSTSVELEGSIDCRILAEIFGKLVDRHDSLRTYFELIKDEPVQKVHDNVDFKIESYDVVEGDKDIGERNEVYLQVGRIIKTFVRPFDLAKAPLLRVGLIKIKEEKHILMTDMHHIISDGISMDILKKEFIELCAGKELPPLRLQYKDYSEWLNSSKVQTAIKLQEEYWSKEFKKEVPKLELFHDYPRPEVQSFEGGAVSFLIDKKETRVLKKIGLKTDATLFMVLFAIYNVLLSKLTGEDDIVVGTGLAGRRNEEFNNIIGMFVNTLALRNFPVREKPFDVFLKEVRENVLSGFENQDYQFERLVEKILPNRKRNRNPLFDTVFVFKNIDIGLTNKPIQEELPGLIVKPYGQANETTQFDIVFSANELDETVVIHVTYSRKLFKKETIEMFVSYFKEIVSKVVDDSDITLKDIIISHNILDAKPINPEMELEFS